MITDPHYHPTVLQAVAADGRIVYVYFDDGSIHRFEASALSGPVFQPLQSPRVFREALTVMGGTVAWDLDGTRSPERCIDLDPIRLYRETPVVSELEVLRAG
jgi:hypothetical protein